MAVARCAAELFWKNGVDGTTGDAIAAAAGVSKRTVWRYFRSKEACVEPLFLATGLRFIDRLRDWPRKLSIESYLRKIASSLTADDQSARDGIAAVRLIVLMQAEPPLRSAWLMACHQAEAELRPIIAARTGRSPDDLKVKLSAAAVMAGIRVMDEEISLAAVNENQRFDRFEPFDRLAAAIRATCILPFCDPVAE